MAATDQRNSSERWRIFRRRAWRKFFANDLIGDLRLIQLQYWPRYRPYFERGTVGSCLGALLRAYDEGHLRSQRMPPRIGGSNA